MHQPQDDHHLTLTPEAALGGLVQIVGKALEDADGRIAIGLAGPPGVGKSTLAQGLVARLNRIEVDLAAYVPMDGFHMRQARLVELGLAADKGASHTFDAQAFIAFLIALKGAKGPVSGPGYSRAIEDVIDDAFTVPAAAQVLVVEGNYLLLPDPPWDSVQPMLDGTVFLTLKRETIRARLLARHAEHGLFTPEQIEAHVERVDMPNYDLIESTRDRADLIISLIAER